jgi:hypothetical protein
VRVKSLGLGVDPWLNEAKRAVRRGEPDKARLFWNIDRIVALAIGADRFFIEAPFLHADVKVAAERRLGPLSRPRGQASKRGGTSLPHEVQTLMESRSFVSPTRTRQIAASPQPAGPACCRATLAA